MINLKRIGRLGAAVLAGLGHHSIPMNGDVRQLDDSLTEVHIPSSEANLEITGLQDHVEGFEEIQRVMISNDKGTMTFVAPQGFQVKPLKEKNEVRLISNDHAAVIRLNLYPDKSPETLGFKQQSIDPKIPPHNPKAQLVEVFSMAVDRFDGSGVHVHWESKGGPLSSKWILIEMPDQWLEIEQSNQIADDRLQWQILNQFLFSFRFASGDREPLFQEFELE